MNGPSSFWLVSADGAPPHAAYLWCDDRDAWDQVLKVDGRYVPFMTRHQLTAYMFGRHGWPVRLSVRSDAGATRTIECYTYAPPRAPSAR